PEDARTIAARHHQELVAHHTGEQCGKNGIQREQQRILLREERGVAARRGEKEQPDRRDGTADDEKQLHRSGAFGSRLSTGAGSWRGERTVKRFQGESSCKSRLVSALSWKGFGRSVGSSRMRTAAS